MNISFIQGIVSYPASGNLQGFLSKTGQYVSIVADNGHTDVAFAHGLSNYLLSESVSVTNAWGPLSANTDYWLYWDINTTTAVRSYGFTALAPIYSASRPISALPDQHWFDLSTKKMFVMQGVRWREVIRVFAAKVNNTTFSPLGSGYPLKPFAGTQVGLLAENTEVGRIISDNVGKPIRRSDGRFFTSMDDFFLDGSPVNAVRFESGIVIASAQTNMAKYQVVKYSDFAEILPAEYNDVETTAIALLMEDALFGSTVSVCIQGVVTNPSWNWPTVGQTLWVGAGGSLVSTDPHVTNPILYPVAKAPVGRVLSETSIIFDQGLGQKGEKGDPGSGSGGSVVPATNAVQGVVRLTVAAGSPADPVVVGDNDPRNTNARVPLAHNQAASTITTPTYGTLTGITADLQLGQLEDGKVAKVGDTMTGPLVLPADPTLPLQAATKAYVDSRPTGATTLDGLTDVTLTSPTNNQILKYNGTQWVNAANSGGGTPDLDLIMDDEVITWSKTVASTSSVQQMWRFDDSELSETFVRTTSPEDSAQVWTFTEGNETPYPATFTQNGHAGDPSIWGSELLFRDTFTSTMPAAPVVGRQWTIESSMYTRAADLAAFVENVDIAIYQVINIGGSNSISIQMMKTNNGLNQFKLRAVPSWVGGTTLLSNTVYFDNDIHVCIQINNTGFRIYSNGSSDTITESPLPAGFTAPYAVSVAFDGASWTKSGQLFMDELRVSSSIRYQGDVGDPNSMTSSFYTPAMPFPRETSHTATIELGSTNLYASDARPQMTANGAIVVTEEDTLDTLYDVYYSQPPIPGDVLSYTGDEWVPMQLPQSSAAETYIVRLATDSSVQFGDSQFNSQFSNLEWNVIQDAAGFERNISGYTDELMLERFYAYRIEITATFDMVGDVPWPDGSTLIGTEILNGFSQSFVTFVTPSKQTHNLWTPSGSSDTPPDGNASIASVSGTSSQSFTDTYIVYNSGLNSAAIKFVGWAARAGAIVENSGFNASFVITAQRLDGNLHMPS